MKIKLLWFFIILLFIVNSVYAVNYVLTYNSVDAWEIRWWWSTTYSSQLTKSISTWNALLKINIAPDTIFTYEDLTFKDVSTAWLAYYARYSNSSSSIFISTVNMNKITSTQKQNVITHELWHALWLAHSISQNIMIRIWEIDRITLWTQDKKDYTYLWWQ